MKPAHYLCASLVAILWLACGCASELFTYPVPDTPAANIERHYDTTGRYIGYTEVRSNGTRMHYDARGRWVGTSRPTGDPR